MIMVIEQINDIDLEQLKKDVEADDNIVSFGLFYDRKRKKMFFVKHGDEKIIIKMADKAAYSISGFANVIKFIVWRFQKKESNANPFGDDLFGPFADIFGKYRKK